MQEALEAQWLLFKPDSWKAQATGKGGPVLFAARFRTQSGRREQNKRQGQRPCLLGDPLIPTPNLGGLEREVCTMSPRGGARAAVVFGPQSPAPTPVCPGHSLQLQGPCPWPRPPSVCTSASCRHVVHPEVVAPGLERVDLEDPNSGRRWGPWASRLSRGDDSVIRGDPGSRKKLVLLLCCQ